MAHHIIIIRRASDRRLEVPKKTWRPNKNAKLRQLHTCIYSQMLQKSKQYNV